MDALHAFIQGKSNLKLSLWLADASLFAEGFVEAQRRWFALASRTTAVRRLQERNSWRTWIGEWIALAHPWPNVLISPNWKNRWNT